MDYWAGSLPGSMKCECGVQGTCIDQEKWCNCDALHSDWNYDGGEISEKEYLPVKALHFGDTGTPLDEKEGRYSLGPLECDGDTLFDNVVTFRRDDAVIELPPFDIGQVTRFNRNASFAADLLKEFSRKENYTIHELSQESFRFCLNMHCIEYGVNINVFNKPKH